MQHHGVCATMTKCSCLGDKCIENLSRSELEILLNDSINQQYYLSAKIADIQKKLYWDNYMTQEEFQKLHEQGIDPNTLRIRRE